MCFSAGSCTGYNIIQSTSLQAPPHPLVPPQCSSISLCAPYSLLKCPSAPLPCTPVPLWPLPCPTAPAYVLPLSLHVSSEPTRHSAPPCPLCPLHATLHPFHARHYPLCPAHPCVTLHTTLPPPCPPQPYVPLCVPPTRVPTSC